MIWIRSLRRNKGGDQAHVMPEKRSTYPTKDNAIAWEYAKKYATLRSYLLINKTILPYHVVYFCSSYCSPAMPRTSSKAPAGTTRTPILMLGYKCVLNLGIRLNTWLFFLIECHSTLTPLKCANRVQSKTGSDRADCDSFKIALAGFEKYRLRTRLN
jgi:hypothetical protein